MAAELQNAVSQLLSDMRKEHGTVLQAPHSASPSPHNSAQQRRSPPSQSNLALRSTAHVEDLQKEVDILRAALANADEALRQERQRHLQTKELLRLALRPAPPEERDDAARAGKLMGSHHGGQQTGGSPGGGSPVPAFVRHATTANGSGHFVPALHHRVVESSGAVQELLLRALDETGTRGHTPSGRQVRHMSPTASSTYRAGGARANHATTPPKSRTSLTAPGAAASSAKQEHPLVFGGRSPRFTNISLRGDHCTIPTRYSEDLTFTLANTPTKRVYQPRPHSPGARSSTPRRGAAVAQQGGDPARSPAPVAASPSQPVAVGLRAAEIASWVQNIAHGRGGD